VGGSGRIFEILKGSMKKTLFFRFFYKIYPPITRWVEKMGFHKDRQPFLLGCIRKKYSPSDFKRYLEECGFEHDVLAWKDSGEVLSMRKVDKKDFQYHVRLFKNGEIRCHYEYVPENHPFYHFFAKYFKARKRCFKKLLKDFI
jgi:hypothetical protein